jgi:elongator complex protein 5
MQEKLAFGGSEGIDVVGEWAHTSVTVPTAKPGAVVGVTVRKPSGGVKGISRYLNAVVAEPTTKGSSGLVVVPLNQLISVNPILTPRDNKTIGEKPLQTHVDLDLPFNLSLTDEQKRRRGEVPLPYAHEGEGVGIEFGDSEDEDDEEI